MTRRRTILVLATAALFAGIGAAYWMLRPTPLVLPPLPEPNGYDDLIAAAQSFVFPFRDQTESDELLREFLERNQLALERLHVGIQRECGVPLYDIPYYRDAALHRQRAFLPFYSLLSAEGELAERQGNLPEAIERYTDNIRLGAQVSRGGTIEDWNTGWFFEEIGVRQLGSLVPKLTGSRCRELIARLHAIDAGREPLANAVERERVLFQNHASTPARFLGELRRLIDGAEHSRNQNQARFRLLLAHLALQAYHQDHGLYPDNLADLVPEYLSAVPEVAYRRMVVTIASQDDENLVVPVETYEVSALSLREWDCDLALDR